MRKKDSRKYPRINASCSFFFLRTKIRTQLSDEEVFNLAFGEDGRRYLKFMNELAVIDQSFVDLTTNQSIKEERRGNNQKLFSLAKLMLPNVELEHRVVNISCGGMAFMSSEINYEGNYGYAIIELNHYDPPLVIEVKISYVIDSDNEKYPYLLGLEFINTEPAVHARLKHFVEQAMMGLAHKNAWVLRSK